MSTFFGTRSEATTDEVGATPSRAEIDREIAKLKEDSARDVERQLAQQRSATKREKVEEDVKEVAEHVEEDLSPVFKAAEHRLETAIKDARADVRAAKRRHERAEYSEEEE